MKAVEGGRCRAGWGVQVHIRGGVTLFSNPIENASEGQSKRSREKGKRMECDNRKMPLMVVSLKRLDVERHLS